MKVFVVLSVLVALTLAEPPRYRQSFEAERDSSYFYFARHQPKESAKVSVEAAAAPYPASGWKPDGPAFNPVQKQQQQPLPAQQQYGPPAAPQQQYGPPAAPQQNYGAPAAPQQNYGAPAAPQKNYGAPAAAAPQQSYGAPEDLPQEQYQAPSAQQQRYRVQATSQRQFGAFQQQQQQQYGAPAAPQQQYGAPAQKDATTTEETSSTEYEESTTLRGDTESQAESVDSVNELEDVGDVDAEQRENGEYFVALPDGRLQRVRSMTRKDLATMKYFARISAENVEPLRGPIYAYSPLQKLEFAPAVLQPTITDSYGAPEKLTQVQQQSQRQPLAAVASANGYNSDYQFPSNDQRFFITI